MLRELHTAQDVKDASEPFIGSYLSKWRIQRTASFSGRTGRGSDKLSQTTFVGDLSEVAAEIIRVCATRPGLTCTNKNGPDADIVSALAAIGVHYADGRLSGDPVQSAPRELTRDEKYAAAQQAKADALAAQQAADAALAALSAEISADEDRELAAMQARADAILARRASVTPVSGVTSISAPVETVETVQTVETVHKPQHSVRK